MKYATVVLPFVAAAAAFVIPDEATAEQLALDTNGPTEKASSSSSPWWHKLSGPVDDLLSSSGNAFDAALDTLNTRAGKLSSFLPKVVDFLPSRDYTSKPGESGHHGGQTNLTVYQAIHASNYTTKFAALVDDYPDLVEKLNSTSANVTAFVPTNKAFEHIPHHDDVPKEFIEKVIQYHIVPGLYPVGRVLFHHTLPTSLIEEHLGGRPQRLRVGLSLFGLRLNFYSKVVVANIETKNGIIHGVESILVPPPPAGKVISLFPTKFSTLQLAAEKTGLSHHRHGDGDGDGDDRPELTGLTLFAPTNTAFERLGPGANAFLFNTEKGLTYLKALLQYHIVVNETLYTDKFYGKKKGEEDGGEGDDDDYYEDGEKKRGEGARHYHLDLPTLLGDAHLAVDVTRWYGFVRVLINGRVHIALEDGLARDGVIQAVDDILIPPRQHGRPASWDLDLDGGIPVGELVARLDPYLERDGGSQNEQEPAAGEL
ncbi:FAS1 domain-containing protein [Durotheca rogersii]|uniref:FAS1 domain-containing protein n=1 Tax=Durotheca rogersii TaxID=419775 RepID=UPI00221EC77A|nr:FAS1 domain-containing protein [Durotheca rogersii]KAI5861087.1 FAS1 domain-containing protein [Durotheca rogersii]